MNVAAVARLFKFLYWLTKQGATFVYTDLEILISIFSMKTNCYHTIYIFATFLTGEMDKS